MTDVTAPPVSQTVVLFGNDAPQMQEAQADGSAISVPAGHLNQSVTRAEMWVGFDDPAFVTHTLTTGNDRMLAMIGRQLDDSTRKYAVGVAEMEQIVAVHTAGAKPAWISSSDSAFAQVLATYFGCPVGEPIALLTNAGRDALHAQHMSTSAQPAAFNYVALTASTTSPAAGDTTLTGEITTAGGGLVRAQATYAHTAGTNTTTLTKTFTANGSDSLPVVLAQIGVFNASSVGTLGYHTAMSATASLAVSGDNVTLTETVTAG